MSQMRQREECELQAQLWKSVRDVQRLAKEVVDWGCLELQPDGKGADHHWSLIGSTDEFVLVICPNQGHTNDKEQADWWQ